MTDYKELLKEILHENLEISVDLDDGHIEVEVYFDGDCICDDRSIVSTRED